MAAEIKYPTSEDIYEGIMGALRRVLEVSGIDRSQIGQAMLGTTQCTNAIVERKSLAPIGILRIGAPATLGIPPICLLYTSKGLVDKKKLVLVGKGRGARYKLLT